MAGETRAYGTLLVLIVRLDVDEGFGIKLCFVHDEYMKCLTCSVQLVHD